MYLTYFFRVKWYTFRATQIYYQHIRLDKKTDEIRKKVNLLMKEMRLDDEPK